MVVAEAVEGSPEVVEKRVCLGNLEVVVVGPLLRLEGNQAGVVVVLAGVGVMVRVLHDRHVSGCLAVIKCKAYVRFLEEDPPAWECHRLYLLPPLL